MARLHARAPRYEFSFIPFSSMLLNCSFDNVKTFYCGDQRDRERKIHGFLMDSKAVTQR